MGLPSVYDHVLVLLLMEHPCDRNKVQASVHSMEGTGVKSQGPCETTLTERFEVDCTCGTYPDNLGPCATFELGGIAVIARCVYCDHTEVCHDKVKR